MRKFIFLIILIPLSLIAAERCLEIPEQQMADWKSMKPPTPALGLLLKAKKIIEAEKEFSLTLGTDKTAHCYLGCRIDHDVNLETAKFIAWQKEYNDATDCDVNTHFDIGDFEATVWGTSCNDGQCADFCKKLYP